MKSLSNKSLRQRIWDARVSYLFIAPLIIGLLIFSYYPAIYGLALSFFEKNSTQEAIFVKHGKCIVVGGDITGIESEAIKSQSTLILSGEPQIKGKEYGVVASSPVRLSYLNKSFAPFIKRLIILHR